MNKMLAAFALLSLVSCSLSTRFASTPQTIPSNTELEVPPPPKEVVRKIFKSFEIGAEIENTPDLGVPKANVVLLTDNSGSMLPYQTVLDAAIGAIVSEIPESRIQVSAYTSTLTSFFPDVSASNLEILSVPAAITFKAAAGLKPSFMPRISVSEVAGGLPQVRIDFQKMRSLFPSADGNLVFHPAMTPIEFAQAREDLKSGMLVGNKGSGSEQLICGLLKLAYEEGIDAPFVRDRGAIIVMTTDTNPHDSSSIFNCPKSLQLSYSVAAPNSTLQYKYYRQVSSQNTKVFCKDEGSPACNDTVGVSQSKCGIAGNCDPISQLNSPRACSPEESTQVMAELARRNSLLPLDKQIILAPGSECSSDLIEFSSLVDFAENEATCASVPLRGGRGTFYDLLAVTKPDLLPVAGSCSKDVSKAYEYSSTQVEYYPGLTASSTGSEIVQAIRSRLSEVTGNAGYSILAIANHQSVNPLGFTSPEKESTLVRELLGSSFSPQNFHSIFNPSYSAVGEMLKNFIQYQVKRDYDLSADEQTALRTVDQAKLKVSIINSDGSVQELTESEFEIADGKLRILASNLSTFTKSFKIDWEE